MTRLNDTQRILLATAAARTNGSVYPLGETVTDGTTVTKAVDSLLKRNLADVRETSDAASIYRTNGDVSFGVFVTDAGKAAIGVVPEKDEAAPAVVPVELPAPRVTKANTIVALLQRDTGATMAELIAATGWLPHTTRAALTGLRKKGNSIERGTRDGATCYHIVVA